MFLQKITRLMLAMVVILSSGITTVYADPPTINLEGFGTQSTQLPDYYPSSFQGTGVINQVSSGGDIVISTLRYRLSSNVLVHSTTTEHSSRYDLQVGKEVGFNFESSGNTRTITEVWILPAGTILIN